MHSTHDPVSDVLQEARRPCLSPAIPMAARASRASKTSTLLRLCAILSLSHCCTNTKLTSFTQPRQSIRIQESYRAVINEWIFPKAFRPTRPSVRGDRLGIALPTALGQWAGMAIFFRFAGGFSFLCISNEVTESTFKDIQLTIITHYECANGRGIRQRTVCIPRDGRVIEMSQIL